MSAGGERATDQYAFRRGAIVGVIVLKLTLPIDVSSQVQSRTVGVLRQQGRGKNRRLPEAVCIPLIHCSFLPSNKQRHCVRGARSAAPATELDVRKDGTGTGRRGREKTKSNILADMQALCRHVTPALNSDCTNTLT